MAQLLGSKYCIESLRNDVTDIQAAVIDVFSRAGPVRFPSWKYPDKISCDLDITELLEMYDYSEDEEEGQVAHIVLMELVIDRLVLLLQAMARYLDQVSCTLGKTRASPQSAPNSTSIGLVVRKYWNKMVHLYTLAQQLQSESKNKARQVTDLEQNISKLTQQFEASKSSILDLPIPLNDADAGRLMGAVTSISSYSISRDDSNKATQTVETAFVPCEACHNVQKHFREVGEQVVHLCSSQGLPSSLAKHRLAVQDYDWLDANDVARWATEQNKDLARINKHLEFLLGTIDPLKSDLTAEQKRSKELQNKMADKQKELERERETQSAQMRLFDGKMKQEEKKSAESVGRVHRRADGLEKSKLHLEKQLDQLKAQLTKQEDMLQQMVRGKAALVEEMEMKMTKKEEVRRLEAEMDGLQTRLQEAEAQLQAGQKELSREKAKNKSVNKHTEAVQTKQGSLLQRLDDLDQENEDLRNQVADLEETKEALGESLERAEEERNRLKDKLVDDQTRLQELSKEKDDLEQSIDELRDDVQRLDSQLHAAKEQERLLVEYPDLNGPVNPDLSGTGDIAVDMENQVKANGTRISVLEEQNNKLRKTISKMMGRHAAASHAREQQVSTKPVALWDTSILNNVDQGQGHHDSATPPSEAGSLSPQPLEHCEDEDTNPAPQPYHHNALHNKLPPKSASRKDRMAASNAADKKLRQQTFIVGTGPKGRPGSASKQLANMAAANQSSIGAYAQLKKSGMIKSKSRPTSGVKAPPTDRSEYQPQDMLACPKCDKMYQSAHELDIHKSYCCG